MHDPDNVWTRRTRMLDAALGALAGGIVSLIFVGLGLVSFALAAVGETLTGGEVSPPAPNEVGALAAYVAAFTVGGGLLGLAAPLLRWLVVKVLAGAIVGAMIMTAFAITDAGGPTAIDRASLIVALAVGGGFGGLVGLVFTMHDRSEEELAAVDRKVEEIDSRVAGMRRIREAKRRRSESRSKRPRPDSSDPMQH